MEALSGHQQDQHSRPLLKKLLRGHFDNAFGRVRDNYLLFCDLMNHNIVEQSSVYHHMGDGWQGKFGKKCLLVSLYRLGRETQPLRRLYHAVGVGSLLICPCDLTDLSDGGGQPILF